MGIKDKISSLIGMSPPKDDSAEAGLSGDLDEVPEELKVSDGQFDDGEEPIPIEEVTEED